VVLARELTKKFEEWLRGTPAELAAEWARRPRKGEFVVMIGPAGEAATTTERPDLEMADRIDSAEPDEDGPE
jgi:16S rRNA (cytidine1402-2'-O)-methyltransferase